MKHVRSARSVLTACAGLAMAGAVLAQDAETEAKKKWSNETELGIVATRGNSTTQTLGLKDTLRRFWNKARFQLKLQGTLQQSGDDRERVVDPGFTWEPGAPPPADVTTTLVTPPVETDNEIYLIEGRYDRDIRKNLTWNAGASWDRNVDAGIINRYIVFGGVGNVWWDREDLHFYTTYGLSWTDRQEEDPDPEKDDRFPGFRFTWDYLNQWGKVTTYENDWTVNVNLKDAADYSFDMVNKLTVSMAKHLSLSVSLQWLYNNEPALEDVDLIAYVEVVDPDGVPGSGDEFIRTTDGGAELNLGEVQERKDSLDTIFMTSLVISF
jgi:hypothetical protein